MIPATTLDRAIRELREAYYERDGAHVPILFVAERSEIAQLVVELELVKVLRSRPPGQKFLDVMRLAKGDK